jgi:hypothetical protein
MMSLGPNGGTLDRYAEFLSAAPIWHAREGEHAA